MMQSTFFRQTDATTFCERCPGLLCHCTIDDASTTNKSATAQPPATIPIVICPACHMCGIELMDLIELLRNEQLRNTEQCELCHIQYNNCAGNDDDQFVNHFQSHFQQDGADQYECINCYDSVVGRQHQTPATNIADTCSLCAQEFKCKSDLNHHRRTVHRCSSSANGSNSDTALLKCRICNGIFNDKFQRRQHEKVAHLNATDNTYKCTVCDGKFSSATAVAYHHRASHSQRRFECNVCAKLFARHHNLVAHQQTHSIESAFGCDQCDAKFKTLVLCRRHERRMHSVDEHHSRRYACAKCDRRFIEYSDLRRHLWTHGGYEKKWLCSVCSRSFMENKLLLRHMRTHDKKKEKQQTPHLQRMNGWCVRNFD